MVAEHPDFAQFVMYQALKDYKVLKNKRFPGWNENFSYDREEKDIESIGLNRALEWPDAKTPKFEQLQDKLYAIAGQFGELFVSVERKFEKITKAVNSDQ